MSSSWSAGYSGGSPLSRSCAATNPTDACCEARRGRAYATAGKPGDEWVYDGWDQALDLPVEEMPAWR